MRRVRGRWSAALVIALLAAGCGVSDLPCVESLVTYSVVPQNVVIAPGDTFTFTATPPRQWSDCSGRSRALRPRVVWRVSDPRVATVVGIDSVRGRVTGIAPGQTTLISAVEDDTTIKSAAAVVVR